MIQRKVMFSHFKTLAKANLYFQIVKKVYNLRGQIEIKNLNIGLATHLLGNSMIAKFIFFRSKKSRITHKPSTIFKYQNSKWERKPLPFNMQVCP